ncbi:MAG: lysophospholipid acyltransferase family protein [Nannocystaceae bacterium]|nr:lysophospholipid acyltransferase family protein [Nannocystaceae bacterium]
MIRSHRWPAFARWFARACERRLHAAFHEGWLAGLEHLREAAAAGPVLIVANHHAWWDAVVALWLSQRVLALEAFALMESAQLQRLRFFGLVGGFGVDRSAPRDGALALRYATTLLDRPGRVLWLFPEGAIVSSRAPLRFEPGAAAIAARVPALQVVPLGLRYEPGDHERPSLWLCCGPPLRPDADVATATAQLQQAVAACLDDIDGRTLAFTRSFGGEARPGLATRLLDRFAGWIIARFGSRLQAAIAAQPQAVLGPAELSDHRRAGPRGEQQ